MIDTFVLVASLVCILAVFFKESSLLNMYQVRILASMACVGMWLQLFFWLRLFDSTAQYVDLIIETVMDISEFMKLLLLLIIMFSTGIYLVELNRLENAYDNSEPVFPYNSELNLMF